MVAESPKEGSAFHKEVGGSSAGTKESTVVQVWPVIRGRVLAGYSPLAAVRGLSVGPVAEV